MSGVIALRVLGWRFAGVSMLAAGLVVLVIAIPTALVPNPLFTRMTPVTDADWILIGPTALVLGALSATYLGRWHAAGRRREASAGWSSGVLGWFAIGCPVCNKLVVALLGFSGALDYFAPVQPFLGALAVVLAGGALRARLRSLTRPCAIVASDPPPT